MPKTFQDTPSIQWSTNCAIYDWFQELAANLGTNSSYLLRSFCLQLKNADPAVTQELPTILSVGMHAAIVDPKVARFYLDGETRGWLMGFVAKVRHPEYQRRRVWVRHLLNGYMLWLRENVEQGAVFRPVGLMREQA